MLDPLTVPCSHTATDAEKERDPDYRFCGAQIGQPCIWAKRTAAFTSLMFHSERLEAAMPPAPTDEASKGAFTAAVLADGEV